MTESLRTRLEASLKQAMLSGDATARDTIRYTLSALKNAEIDNRGPLTPQEELALLQREAKRRVDSIDQFRQAGRQDLVDREEAQLAILTSYLPAQLSEEELRAMVQAAISETGASSIKELGKVMPILVERAAGRADGKRLSEALRAELAGQTA